MLQKNNKKKTTIVFNKAVHGRPHLNIDRAIDMGPLDHSDPLKDKKLGQ